MNDTTKTNKARMIRTLSILVALAVLAVSAAPGASASPSKAGVPRPGTSFTIDIGTSEKMKGIRAVNHIEGTGRVVRDRVKGGLKGIVTDNNDPDALGAMHARRARVIESLAVKDS